MSIKRAINVYAYEQHVMQMSSEHGMYVTLPLFQSTRHVVRSLGTKKGKGKGTKPRCFEETANITHKEGSHFLQKERQFSRDFLPFF